MNREKFQVALQSRTVRFALSALLVMAVKWAGLPLLPADVSNEVIMLVLLATDAVVMALVTAAAWFRIKATTMIKGWW